MRCGCVPTLARTRVLLRSVVLLVARALDLRTVLRA